MAGIPLGLPPPVGVPPLGLRRNEVKPPVLGEEISYENLVPGQRYFHRTHMPPMRPSYQMIEFRGKNNATAPPRRFFNYTVPRQLSYELNERGDPLPPYVYPQAPRIFGAQNTVVQDEYDSEIDRFYKVSPVKEGRHYVGQTLKNKLKRNIRRKHVNTVLSRMGLPTELGVGPANTIRKALGLQPPKQTRNNWSSLRQRVPHPYNTTLKAGPLPYGPKESNFAGGKRKTRKQRRRKYGFPFY